MPWTVNKSEVCDPFTPCPAGGRVLNYAEAIRDGLYTALKQDPQVFLMGQDVDAPGGMFGTTRNLQEEFGSDRVFDNPLSEASLMGIAMGAALAGKHPIYFHNRPDFLLLAMDQLVNHAAKWHYMFGGAVNVPLVVWACVGKGWGSAAQHSQALQGLFMIPGLKLVMPSTGYDAKGLLLAAVADPNPVIIIEHRSNFSQKGYVPEGNYTVPIGKGIIRRVGTDITVVVTSHLVLETFYAAQELSKEGIEVEIVDLRTLNPMDEKIILDSVFKTGHLLVTDTGWKTGGITAEISAMVAEKGFTYLKAPIKRLAAPDLPTPAGYTLEEAYYFGKEEIKQAIKETI